VDLSVALSRQQFDADLNLATTYNLDYRLDLTLSRPPDTSGNGPQSLT
jgi:hypothetical protein